MLLNSQLARMTSEESKTNCHILLTGGEETWCDLCQLPCKNALELEGHLKSSCHIHSTAISPTRFREIQRHRKEDYPFFCPLCRVGWDFMPCWHQCAWSLSTVCDCLADPSKSKLSHTSSPHHCCVMICHKLKDAESWCASILHIPEAQQAVWQ